MNMKNLLSNDLRKQIKGFLSSPLCNESFKELTKTVTVIELLEILLETNDVDDITLITEAIKRFTILGVIDELIFDYPNVFDMLSKGSQSKIENVRILVSFILNSIASNSESCKKLCDSGFYLILGVLIRDSAISVGESASKTFQLIAQYCPKYVYEEKLIQIMKENFSSLKDETRLRIIDTYISIGSISEDLFNICQGKGEFYSLALKEYFTEDILLKLVSMKLLEDMGEYEWGVKFIVNNSTPELLIEDLNNPMFDDEIKISIIYLLSKMVNNNPKLSESILKLSNKTFLRIFKEFMNYYGSYGDTMKVICAINCWGLFAANLLSFKSLYDEWQESFELMLKFVSNSNSEISLTSLNSWVILFESKEIENILDNVRTDFEMRRIIENKLIPTIFSVVISKPFPENRTLLYRLLILMIPHFTCITSNICSNSKLRELILNPNSDSNKDILYIKYDLVKQMMKFNQEIIKNLSDQHFYSSIEQYVRSGPFYKFQSSEMQVEDIAV